MFLIALYLSCLAQKSIFFPKSFKKNEWKEKENLFILVIIIQWKAHDRSHENSL